jgi:hypothetical protein
MRVLLAAIAVLSLSACSTKTLININLDAESFLPPDTRENAVPVTAGSFRTRLPDDDGDAVNGNDPDGAVINLSALSVLERASLNVRLRLDTSATGALALYIAPGNTTNLYQPQYRVLQGSTASADLSANVVLSATSSDPAQVQAFNAIKSGSFRIGVEASGTAGGTSSVKYRVENLDVSVSGYPIRLLF